MHLQIDKYWENDSPIHRLDPRLRIVAVAVAACVFIAVRSLPALALGCVLSWTLIFVMGIPLRACVKRLAAVTVILSPMLVLFVLFAPWRERVTALSVGACVLLRGFSLVLLAFPLFNASRFSVTMAAFRALGVPRTAVSIFSLAYRSIFLFLDDRRRMELSAATRGWEGGSFKRRAALVGSHLGSLLTRSLSRTERVWHAMKSRAFEGEWPQCVRLSISGSDLGTFAVLILCAASVAICDVVVSL